MNKVQALYQFWVDASGLVAYDETSVPDDAVLPYMTYETVSDSFGNEVAVTASLWYRSTSWQQITQKEMAISDYIGRGGRMVAYDGGAFWIKKANPWAQRLSEASDDIVRRIVLNASIEFID